MTTTYATPIAEAARLFTNSYGKAMELSSHKSFKPTDRSRVAKALSSHFGPTTIFVMGGPPITMNSSTDWMMPMESQLARFEGAGIGYDIFLEKSRIELQGTTSAACFITWRIRPAPIAKVESWSWENTYMYRRGGPIDPKDEQHRVGFPGEEWTIPEGRWEAIFSDNEMEELLARFPDLMNDLQ